MLTEIRLRHFRCFERLTAALAPGFNFFLGANGQGKTTVLEAACVLLRLQSQRSRTLAPLVQHGADTFLLRGRLGSHDLEFLYGGLQRRVRFDGVDQRRFTEYLQLGRVVSLSNADIELVRGGGDGRRRYLDFVGSQIDPIYRPTLRSYERALRGRNALLKSQGHRRRELAAYDQVFLQHGARLEELRAALVEKLAPLAQRIYAEISTSREEFRLGFAGGVKGDFAEAVARSRPEEERLRQTIVGPHRDELRLLIDGSGAAQFASEGQQRSIVLALKLAQGELFAAHHGPPLLLLDDIFGELDAERRNALLDHLPPASQKLVTATAIPWRDELPASRRFQLRDRVLREMN